MKKSILTIKTLVLATLALVVGSLAPAEESLWIGFTPETKMDSLIDTKQFFFSVSPQSQMIQFTIPKNLPLKFIIVDQKTNTKCSFTSKTHEDVTIKTTFSGINNKPKSIFKKGYSAWIGTYNYFQLTLADTDSNQVNLLCTTKAFFDWPKFSQFQEAFAREHLKLSVDIVE